MRRMPTAMAAIAASLMFAACGQTAERQQPSHEIKAASRPGDAAATAALTVEGSADANRQASTSSEQQQDAETARIVNRYLNEAFAASGSVTIGKRTENAFDAALTFRNQRSGSLSIPERNAEYYLLALQAAVQRNAGEMVTYSFAPLYDGLKWAAQKCAELTGQPWIEEAIRTNPNNPTSPPGGWPWAYRGLSDGIGITNGSQRIGPRPAGHGLSLPHIQRAAACTAR